MVLHIQDNGHKSDRAVLLTLGHSGGAVPVSPEFPVRRRFQQKSPTTNAPKYFCEFSRLLQGCKEGAAGKKEKCPGIFLTGAPDVPVPSREMSVYSDNPIPISVLRQ